MSDINPSSSKSIETYEQSSLSLFIKYSESLVGLNVSDLPTDFLYLNEWSILPRPSAASIKNSHELSEKQIYSASVFLSISLAFYIPRPLR